MKTKQGVYFTVARFMGRTFYQIRDEVSSALLSEIGTPNKRNALRIAKQRGYRWTPLAGVIT